MSLEQNKELVRRFITEVFEKGNLAALDKVLAPDFIEHEAVPGFAADREGTKQAFAMLIGGFGSRRVTIHDLMAEGDKVICRQTWHGVHAGTLMGIPATGNTIAYPVVDVLRIEDGRIREHWGVADNLMLMQQIGAIPTPEGEGL